MIFGFRRRPEPVAASIEQASIELSCGTLDYRLRRSARRTLALRVDHRGVQVSAPQRMTRDEVERFVAANRRWLERKLEQLSACAQLQAFEPVDGACFPLQGRDARLRLGTGRGRVRWVQGEDGVEELWVGAEVDIRAAMLRALKTRAASLFAPRLAACCARLGVVTPPLRLSSARTRWGSCSTRSGIRLHWRLVHVAPGLLDYVVAHEVAHLIEMNHSPRFWQIVATLYPDWQAARAMLNEAARMLPAIDDRDRAAPQDL